MERYVFKRRNDGMFPLDLPWFAAPSFAFFFFPFYWRFLLWLKFKVLMGVLLLFLSFFFKNFSTLLWLESYLLLVVKFQSLAILLFISLNFSSFSEEFSLNSQNCIKYFWCCFEFCRLMFINKISNALLKRRAQWGLSIQYVDVRLFKLLSYGCVWFFFVKSLILSLGIYIINLGKTWEKLQLAARVIVGIENPQDIIVQSARPYGQRAVLKFAQHTGAHAIAGRHTPGTFTNQLQTSFNEPRLLILTDPRTDHQVFNLEIKNSSWF